MTGRPEGTRRRVELDPAERAGLELFAALLLADATAPARRRGAGCKPRPGSRRRAKIRARAAERRDARRRDEAGR